MQVELRNSETTLLLSDSYKFFCILNYSDNDFDNRVVWSLSWS